MEKLSKNMIWMAASNITASAIGAVLLIYLARTLLPEAFGYLSYALTIVFFLINFVDLGLSTFGAREVAKARMRAPVYVSEIVSFRLIIACILSVIFIVAVYFWAGLAGRARLILLEAALIFFVYALATEWAFQGLERMHMIFISLATTSLLQLGLALSFVKGPQDAWKVPLIYFIAAMPIAVIYLSHFKFKAKIGASDINSMGAYLSSSVIIWAIALFAQVYNSLDVFILGFFRSFEEVGYYTVARRAIGAATILAVFLANALLPRLSSVFSKDMAHFRDATRRFLVLSACMTFFVFLPVLFFARELILAAFGSAYLAVATPLKIMILGLILVVFNMPYSTGLLAAGMEKQILKQTAFCASLSVMLNMVLMSRFGMTGAAVTFFIVEAVALAWILWVYRKRISLKAF
jgi:O-antigen/teichoic acid export membrane protein